MVEPTRLTSFDFGLQSVERLWEAAWAPRDEVADILQVLHDLDHPTADDS